MADDGEEKGNSNDFYEVLGLNKGCTETELRSAYKKLALRWHPDRCGASGNSNGEEEATMKFQSIQQAYSVLSDSSKRLLYDFGVYDNDEEENGMGDFLNEMATMMSQTKPNENIMENCKELQDLFNKMFQDDIDAFGASSRATTSSSSSSSSSSYMSSDTCKVEYSGSTLEKSKVESSCFSSNAVSQKFCLGVEHQQEFKKGKGVKGGIQGGAGGRHNNGGKQKFPDEYDVLSREFLLHGS